MCICTLGNTITVADIFAIFVIFFLKKTQVHDYHGGINRFVEKSAICAQRRQINLPLR